MFPIIISILLQDIITLMSRKYSLYQ